MLGFPFVDWVTSSDVTARKIRSGLLISEYHETMYFGELRSEGSKAISVPS
jgi:hypothetical protein